MDLRPNYIGITGFMAQSEIEAVLDVLPQGSKRLVMIGVLASHKSLWGEASNPRRYPRSEDLKDLFFDHPNALNLVHFNSREVDKLLADLIYVLRLAGPHCHGCQLNIAWPDPMVLHDLHHHLSGFGRKIEIVLQCGGKALEQIGWLPQSLAHRLSDYEEVIDHVLIDPSGGRGKEFHVDFVSSCFHAISEVVPRVGLGVAGGLCAANIDRVRPLVLEFPKFSIDIESGVRDNEDHLVVAEARECLVRADKILG